MLFNGIARADVSSGAAGQAVAIRRPTGLVKPLSDFGQFVRMMRVQTRFGELSRAPLSLLRVELRGDFLACDWMARPSDKWDWDLERSVRERHASMQALQDAIVVRDLLFWALPNVDEAQVRVFRQSTAETPDFIIHGTVMRDQRETRYIPSVAMRAKLCGFKFLLDEGVLKPLPHDQEKHD